MRLIGCDLHASQQSIAMLDRDTGEIVEKTLTHEGGAVRAFYAAIPPPVVVGIEATGSMGWFLRLMEELGIECRVGHPTAIRKAETRRQKHDRRDAALLLQLLAEDRFPAIWMPSTEYRISGPYSCTAISGFGCGRAYRTRCTRSCWRTACGVATRCGIVTARRASRPCRYRRTRRIAAASSKRCISTCRRISIDSTTESSTWRMSVLERRC